MPISPLAGKPAPKELLVIYKIYAESFKDQNHLVAIVEQAQEIVTDALGSPAPALREQEVHG